MYKTIQYFNSGKDEACEGILTEAEEIIKSPDRNGDGRKRTMNTCVSWPLGHHHGNSIYNKL